MAKHYFRQINVTTKQENGWTFSKNIFHSLIDNFLFLLVTDTTSFLPVISQAFNLFKNIKKVLLLMSKNILKILEILSNSQLSIETLKFKFFQTGWIIIFKDAEISQKQKFSAYSKKQGSIIGRCLSTYQVNNLNSTVNLQKFHIGY